jgi:hypothetical protein
VTPAPNEWQTLANLAVDGASSLATEALIPRQMQQLPVPLMTWVQTASLADVVEWIAPTHLAAAHVPPVLDTGLWLVDRFTNTYVEEWQPSSRFMEWQYIHGLTPGCCPPDEMAQRRVNQEELATLIADRATERWQHRSDRAPSTSVDINEFSTPAILHLEAGRRSTALAIYESLVRIRPSDNNTRNNYGFCLIPDDPARALKELEKAAELGYEAPVNAANRALCHMLLGHSEECERLANEVIDSSHADRLAYVWEYDGDKFNFAGPLDVREYARGLIGLAA